MGKTEKEFMIGKVYENFEEWNQFDFRLIKTCENLQNCVPIMLKKYASQILVLGNYSILLKKLQKTIPDQNIFLLTPSETYDKISKLYTKMIKNKEFHSIDFLIKNSLGLVLQELKTNLSKTLFFLFSSKFQLFECLKMIQKIFLLKDPSFIELIEEIFEEFFEQKEVTHVAEKINNFFREKNLKFFFCECSSSLVSLSQIKILLKVPEAFNYIFENSIEKYSKILSFLLMIKFTNFSLKRKKFD